MCIIGKEEEEEEEAVTYLHKWKMWAKECSCCIQVADVVMGVMVKCEVRRGY